MGTWFKRAKTPTFESIVPKTEQEREVVVALTERLLTSLDGGAQLMLTETSALGRWLLASLLTLNGGALAAVLSADRLAQIPISGPAATFAVGCVLAILTGLVSLLSARTIAAHFAIVQAHLVRDLKLGEIREVTLEANHAMTVAGTKILLTSVVIGFLSVCAFVGGACWLSLVV